MGLNALRGRSYCGKNSERQGQMQQEQQHQHQRVETSDVFEAEALALILAGAITKITQITSPSKLYRRF